MPGKTLWALLFFAALQGFTVFLIPQGEKTHPPGEGEFLPLKKGAEHVENGFPEGPVFLIFQELPLMGQPVGIME